MRLLPLLLLLALLAPLTAGCLGEEPAPPTSDAAGVASSAEAAGATSGEAPSAPKGAYRLEAEAGRPVVVHPVPVLTNPAKAPVVLDLSGEVGPTDCRPLQFGQQEGQLAAVSNARRFHDLSGEVAVGDVFAYEIRMAYVNAPDNWAEIHPSYGIGSTIVAHDEPTGEVTEPIEIVWTGQAYRANDEDPAFVAVRCDFGLLKEPIPYELTVKLTFAEAAVPAESPMRLSVPEGATRLFVTGVPVDAGRGVLSHFRLFAPDDTLVCECALGSSDAVRIVDLEVAGEYVLLVDHTDNGFVSVALDVPPEAPLAAMESEWVWTEVLRADGGAVDERVEVDFPRVPLFLDAIVLARETQGGGAGQATGIVLANGRGEVARFAWGGHWTMTSPTGPGSMWLGIPSLTGAWERAVDHHAFAPGSHEAHVTSDFLRGEVWLLTRHYVR
jgi:hypothetical protein